ncbi:MAG: helix-turn-helix transcriptional regulator [Pseudomonadota bacterium]
MLSKAHTEVRDQNKELRVAMGVWLRGLREGQGLSQRELANALNLEYYTFISQLENGRGRIPPSRYTEWAHALGQDPKAFVKAVLYYYDPVSYAILFEGEGAPNAVAQ